jgi:hypothetical protein
MNTNNNQSSRVDVADELRDAFETFIDGTEIRHFIRGFKKLVRGMILASMQGGLADAEEIEVFKDVERLSDCLDIIKNRSAFTEDFRAALEVFIDGTDLVRFNRGFRRLVHRRMVMLMEEGLVETAEIEVLKDLELLFDCLDVMEAQCPQNEDRLPG